MQINKPIVLSIAGFDPCAGAGVLADIKTFEQLGVQGMAVLTANTIQTEDTFVAVEWQDIAVVVSGIRTLMNRYPISVVKIGIVPDFKFLKIIVDTLRKENPTCFLIWDPVIRSSTGYSFFNTEEVDFLSDVLRTVNLLTPNLEECHLLADYLSDSSNVLVKGGHDEVQKGWDTLKVGIEDIAIPPGDKVCYAKHGSGCVLSAAIAAQVAQGKDLLLACQLGKIYVERFLNSHPSLLGYHNNHD